MNRFYLFIKNSTCFYIIITQREDWYERKKTLTTIPRLIRILKSGSILSVHTVKAKSRVNVFFT